MSLLPNFFLESLNSFRIIGDFQRMINELKAFDNSSISPDELQKAFYRIIIIRNIKIAIMRLISVLCSFLTPLLIDSLMNSFQNNQNPADIMSNDTELGEAYYWSLACILVLNMAISLLVDTFSGWQINKLKYEVSVLLKYLIYTKLMRTQELKSNCQNELNSDSNLHNLITGDTETVTGFFVSFHSTWGSGLSLIITIIILFIKV